MGKEVPSIHKSSKSNVIKHKKTQAEMTLSKQSTPPTKLSTPALEKYLNMCRELKSISIPYKMITTKEL